MTTNKTVVIKLRFQLFLQKRIPASQGRVKMEASAKIPQADTHAAARMNTLETTAIVSFIAIVYMF